MLFIVKFSFHSCRQESMINTGTGDRISEPKHSYQEDISPQWRQAISPRLTGLVLRVSFDAGPLLLRYTRPKVRLDNSDAGQED